MGAIEQAIELLEKANADLEPELLAAPAARKLLAAYARAERLAAFGVATLTRKVSDCEQVAAVTGTSMGKAKAVVATGKVLRKSDALSTALQSGTISLDQATEIASAEQSSPGAAAGLVRVARKESFYVLKEKARKVKLEAERHRNLAARQHAARSARSYNDPLGMVNIYLRLEPHVGTPIVARAEAEAQRLARQAKKAVQNRSVEPEPFERYLADAYVKLLAGKGEARPRRPELVVLVDYDVARRGWKDVKEDEVCKIPGVGPLSPHTAKQIAQNAFVSSVVNDGKDLRQFKRWSRHIPVEVAVALELGDPPEFDGVRCADCGNRFRTEFDHVQPVVARGPTSHPNLKPRCWSCHHEKTRRDSQRPKSAEP